MTKWDQSLTVNFCDNRERRSTRAEERTDIDTFETPVCPNGGHGGYLGTVATKTEEASGSVGAEETVEVTEGLPLSSKWIQRTRGGGEGAKNLQILNTGKIIMSPYSLQTSLWKWWLLACQGASVFVKKEKVKLLSVCPQHWVLSVCFPLYVKLHCFGSRKAHLKAWA